MSTITAARDAIIGTIRTAWLASGTTSSIALTYDNVADDKVGEDSSGLPLPWARVTVRHLTSPQETLGGVGNRKHLTEGLVTVQVFTPFGDGHAQADEIVQVLQGALRNVRVDDLWFFDVRVNEIGRDGPWFNTNVVAGFRYEERS